MKEENKKSKKKLLLYYLILAACLLVIAAVTVTVIFTVKGSNPSDITIENPNNDKNKPDNPDKPGTDDPDDNKDPDNTDKPDKPTTSTTEFMLPVKTANVTSGYDFVYDVTLDRYCVHQGMDFGGKAGDEVCAVLDGKVSKVVAGHVINENYVTVTHANGIVTTYRYIDAKQGLKEGDTVKRGDVIGTIAVAGGMEMEQGEHLHFEVSVNGKPANPDDYLDVIEK